MALFRSRKRDEPAGNPAPTGERPNRDAVSEAVDICTTIAQDYLFKALAGRSDAVGILNSRGSSAEEGWGGRSAPRPTTFSSSTQPPSRPSS